MARVHIRERSPSTLQALHWTVMTMLDNECILNELSESGTG